MGERAAAAIEAKVKSKQITFSLRRSSGKTIDEYIRSEGSVSSERSRRQDLRQAGEVVVTEDNPVSSRLSDRRLPLASRHGAALNIVILSFLVYDRVAVYSTVHEVDELLPPNANG